MEVKGLFLKDPRGNFRNKEEEYITTNKRSIARSHNKIVQFPKHNKHMMLDYHKLELHEYD